MRACVLALLLAACSQTQGRPDLSPEARVLDGPTKDQKGGRDAAGWVLKAEESFEQSSLGAASWSADTYPDDGPFSDKGTYFQGQGVTPPSAHRLSLSVGTGGWLTLEAYSRSSATKLSDLARVVTDPSGGTNRVLRLAAPAHTDAVVVRSTQPLPRRYRISLRVGHAQFGDGQAGQNGYDSGDERAEPWVDADATSENGFYWLAILDALPRPHNNVWIHHHRKLVVDSDNHHPAWMEIWDGAKFYSSGSFPVHAFVASGKGKGYELVGKPLVSHAAGTWQPAGKARALDAYRSNTWYRVTLERFDDTFSLELSGEFKHGGTKTYRASIDAAAECVWHYNQTPLASGASCVDTTYYPSLGAAHPHWPAGKSWPDWLMFGEPHANYYEGFVYYDDVRFEVWGS